VDYSNDAERQRKRDLYYMSIAEAVRARANCKGSEVGAVLVRGNRVISTGYNGTPAGFQNCLDGGCLRCEERAKRDEDSNYESSHPETMEGKALDICFCVHAEQNTLLNAARHGIAVEHAVLYSTHQPCFSCLKESVQAGIQRIVFLVPWFGAKGEGLQAQYRQLTEELSPVKGGSAFHELDRAAYEEYRAAQLSLVDVVKAAEEEKESGEKA
jgi:dCMP deaminase